MPWGAIDIVGVCLCYGIDSNLTRKAPASDALQISAVKGLGGELRQPGHLPGSGLHRASAGAQLPSYALERDGKILGYAYAMP